MNARFLTRISGPAVLRTAACALLLVAAVSARAQDEDPRKAMLEQIRKSREAMVKTVEDSRTKQGEEFGKLSARMQAQYDAMVDRMERQREELRQRVEKQWVQFHESSNKTWVDYSPKADSVSKVDFEKGEIEIETLVPVEEVAPGKTEGTTFHGLDQKAQAQVKALAEEKIVERTRDILSREEEPKTEVLKDQVRAPDGKPVTPKDAERFVKETVAPKMTVEDKPVVAEDGKPRLKVKVKIPLTPDHLKVRAQRHKEQVDAVAKRHGLDPALLYAVIHTESFFNPLARSNAPAFGLMQLIPRFGAKEAYRFLHNEDRVPDPEYLYDPDNNIALGGAYLHLLQSRYFPAVKDPDSRRMLSIAAYNCGPGKVKKDILAKKDVNALSPEEVSGLVRTVLPQETRQYLPRVEERMALYRGM